MTQHILPLAAAALATCLLSTAHADEAEQERIAAEEAVETLQIRSEPTTPRRSTGAMVFGISLTSLGFIGLVGGLVSEIGRSVSARAPAYDSGLRAGPAIMVAGGVCALAGVPLIVYGAQRKVGSARLEALPTVAVGPASVQVEVAF